MVSVENSACSQVVKLANARAVGGLGNANRADCPWFHGIFSGVRCEHRSPGGSLFEH